MSDRPKNIHQNSIRAPFLTYLVLCICFFMIHSLLFLQSPLLYFSYSLIAPLCILFLIQRSTPFFTIPLTGFFLSSLLQSVIHPNSRYVVANGCLGAVAWTISYLVSRWVIHNLYPVSSESVRGNHSTEQHLSKVSMPDTKKVSVSDLLMDRGHTGHYLTLDTVVGPGLSTRRGYSMFGGGADCGAPPRTIMTFPDFIPQIPCKSD